MSQNNVNNVKATSSRTVSLTMPDGSLYVLDNEEAEAIYASLGGALGKFTSGPITLPYVAPTYPQFDPQVTWTISGGPVPCADEYKNTYYR